MYSCNESWYQWLLQNGSNIKRDEIIIYPDEYFNKPSISKRMKKSIEKTFNEIDEIKRNYGKDS